jgi:ribonuclease BN (tRNA processing enzyme)
LEEAKVAFEKLDGGEIVMKIKPVQPGDCIRLSSSTTVKVLRTTHRVPSQGYAIFSTQPGKLKEEYRSKTGQELKELRSSGADLKDADTETLEMVYTGDTTFESLLLPENACMLHAPVLIMEMTYLDGPHEKAIEYGHIHIDDVVKYAEIFQNSHIVFCHLSSKYAPHGRALKQLQEVLPEQLQSRAYVMLKSFGSHDMVTRIAEVDLERMNKEVGWGWAQKVPLDAPSEVQLASSTTPIDESSSAVGTEAEAVHSR